MKKAVAKEGTTTVSTVGNSVFVEVHSPRQVNIYGKQLLDGKSVTSGREARRLNNTFRKRCKRKGERKS